MSKKTYGQIREQEAFDASGRKKNPRTDERERKILQLEEQVQNLLKQKAIHFHETNGERVKIGIVSDTHLGSLYDNKEFLNAAYEHFVREGISNVYHAGDIVDGQGNYRGQEYEQYAVGFDRQLEVVVKEYPFDKRVKTFFIEGNHSFRKLSGAFIGKSINQVRDDLVFLGAEDADVYLGSGKKIAKMKLIHPSGGTAYSLSYRPQKIMESFEPGTKPNILVIGHFHKSEMIPNYRGIIAFQAGAFQRQTPYMKAKSLAAMCGFWVLDLEIDNWGVNNIEAKFYPYYERGRLVK